MTGLPGDPLKEKVGRLIESQKGILALLQDFQLEGKARGKSDMQGTQDKTTREVCADLGVEYEDLMKLFHGDRDRIPVRKTGVGYLWSPEAVSVVRRLLADRSDRKAVMRQTEEAENYLAALAQLRRAGQDIQKLGASLLAVDKALRRNPPTATGFIHSLPDTDLRLIAPLAVLLSPTDRRKWKAALAETGLEAVGRTREKAMAELRAILVRTYKRLRAAPDEDPVLWQTLGQLMGPRNSKWVLRSRGKQTSNEGEERTAGGE
jgi:hypothetical protein